MYIGTDAGNGEEAGQAPDGGLTLSETGSANRV